MPQHTLSSIIRELLDGGHHGRVRVLRELEHLVQRQRETIEFLERDGMKLTNIIAKKDKRIADLEAQLANTIGPVDDGDKAVWASFDDEGNPVDAPLTDEQIQAKLTADLKNHTDALASAQQNQQPPQ